MVTGYPAASVGTPLVATIGKTSEASLFEIRLAWSPSIYPVPPQVTSEERDGLTNGPSPRSS